MTPEPPEAPEPLFVVCWELRSDPKIGSRFKRGWRFPLAAKLAEVANLRYPPLLHWIEPYTEDKKMSTDWHTAGRSPVDDWWATQPRSCTGPRRARWGGFVGGVLTALAAVAAGCPVPPAESETDNIVPLSRSA